MNSQSKINSQCAVYEFAFIDCECEFIDCECEFIDEIRSARSMFDRIRSAQSMNSQSMNCGASEYNLALCYLSPNYMIFNKKSFATITEKLQKKLRHISFTV